MLNREFAIEGAGPMIVTCWYRDRGDGFKYNHYSAGFDPEAVDPPYMFESQRISWSNGLWLAKEGRFENGVVTEIEPIPVAPDTGLN
jgi:hypothetical protein